MLFSLCRALGQQHYLKSGLDLALWFQTRFHFFFEGLLKGPFCRLKSVRLNHSKLCSVATVLLFGPFIRVYQICLSNINLLSSNCPKRQMQDFRCFFIALQYSLVKRIRVELSFHFLLSWLQLINNNKSL